MDSNQFPSSSSTTSTTTFPSVLNQIDDNGSTNSVVDLTLTDHHQSFPNSMTFVPILDTCEESDELHPSINTTNSSISSSMITPNLDPTLLASLVADLVCSACGRLTQQSQLEPDGKTMNANVLVECVRCGALFHQMCHKPPIYMQDHALAKQQWLCFNCSSALMIVRPFGKSQIGENVQLVTQMDNFESNESLMVVPKSLDDNSNVVVDIGPTMDGELKLPTMINSIDKNNVDDGCGSVQPNVGARKRKSGFVNFNMIRKMKQ